MLLQTQIIIEIDSRISIFKNNHSNIYKIILIFLKNYRNIKVKFYILALFVIKKSKDITSIFLANPCKNNNVQKRWEIFFYAGNNCASDCNSFWIHVIFLLKKKQKQKNRRESCEANKTSQVLSKDPFSYRELLSKHTIVWVGIFPSILFF